MAQGHPFYVPQPVRVYERLIHLLVAQGKPAEALEVAEHFKARAFVDLLGRKVERLPSRVTESLLGRERQLRRQLESLQRKVSFQAQRAQLDELARVTREHDEAAGQIRLQDDEYAEALFPLRQRAARYQAALDDDTALIEYVVGSRETTAWVVTLRGVEAVVIPRSATEVGALVAAAQRTLRSPGDLHATQATLSRLSAAVLHPVLARVPASARRLVVVGHGVLHLVPFAALPDLTGRYLLETRAVVAAPSASSLGYCERKNPRRSKGFDVPAARGVAFALGLAPPPSTTWLPLPGTLVEARGVARSLPGTQVIEGAAMTLEAIRREAPRAAVLHFATHGRYDPDSPLDSCLVTSDGTLPAADIFGLRLRAYSVVLSACQTALGKLRAGDDIVGLTRAFIYAGTPAVISTLWKIADAPTADLMQAFYKRLASSDRADALRAAQLELLARPETSHPYYWAAFVVTGDWK